MTESFPSPDPLKPGLAQLASSHAAMRSRLSASIVRTRWATGTIGAPRPSLDALIHGWPEPRWIETRVHGDAGATELGFDVEGRLLIERAYTNLAGHFRETLYTHHEASIDVASYDVGPDGPTPSGIARLGRDGARIRDYVYLGRDGRTLSERYAYDAHGRLATLHRRSGQGELVLVCTYDAQAQITEISASSDGAPPRVVYRRPTHSSAELSHVVHDAIVAFVLRRLAALELLEPAFAVALVYDPSSALATLPPKLVVGLVSDRARWKLAQEPPRVLWDPESFALLDDARLAYDDDDLLDAAADLARGLEETSESASEDARALVITIARSLNERGLGDVLSVTPDFVVVPVDLRLDLLEEDFEETLPPDVVAQLRARGEL